MNYSICKYGKEWAIFCAQTRCFVLFGKKKIMEDRCRQLNAGTYSEQLASIPFNKL